MSNKSIAIGWAKEQAKKTNGPVMSDQFFGPFNDKQRSDIIKKLAKKDIACFSYTPDGAILIHKRNPHLKVVTAGGKIGGVYTVGENNMMLIGSEFA